MINGSKGGVESMDDVTKVTSFGLGAGILNLLNPNSQSERELGPERVHKTTVFCDLLLNQTHGNMESVCFI